MRIQQIYRVFFNISCNYHNYDLYIYPYTIHILYILYIYYIYAYHTHTIHILLPYKHILYTYAILYIQVTLAERKDPRIQAEKDRKKLLKDADKNAKEADSKRKAEEEAAAKLWVESLETEFQNKNNLNKVEKEKLKKNQSNARNILRKLLRISATKGHGSGEYGIVTTADVEVICANSDLEDLNIMNTALGGAAAVKDEGLFMISGADEVISRLAVMQVYTTPSPSHGMYQYAVYISHILICTLPLPLLLHITCTVYYLLTRSYIR